MHSIIMPLLLLGVGLNAAAQLLLKAGVSRIGAIHFTLQNIVPLSVQLAFNPYIFIGLTCYVISVGVWIMVLSRVDLSYAYPMLSLGYIVTAFAGYYLFDENLTFVRISGIVLIMLGVYLITRTHT